MNASRFAEVISLRRFVLTRVAWRLSEVLGISGQKLVAGVKISTPPANFFALVYEAS